MSHPFEDDEDRFLAPLMSIGTQEKLEEYWDTTLSWAAFLLKWGTLPLFFYIGLNGKAQLMFGRGDGGASHRTPELMDLLVLQEPLPADLTR